MIATFDIGNSSVGVCLYEQGLEKAYHRFSRGSSPSQALLQSLRQARRRLGVCVHGRDPSGYPWLAEIGRIEWVGQDLRVPGKVAYAEPKEMGWDRRVVAFAALCKFGPSLVIDAGTAVTFTHIDAEERVHGMAISAGLGCLARGLSLSAPALAPWLEPPAELPEAALPDGSRDNLAIGIRIGWQGLVRKLYEDARRRLETAHLRGHVVLTGTDMHELHEALATGTLAGRLIHFGLWGLAGEGENGT
ncbi:MAG: hypothetical protein CSA62_03555 [Planctomycetota bacterium]|nr:MAG: hypothetical protein CSA62_03555 [Planctomycetota bacterium]